MKKWIAALWVLAGATAAHGQLFSSTATSSGLTEYTNGASNDSLYYYCTGALGELSALPPFGTGPFDFQWQEFNQPTNSWYSYITESDVYNSTISNLDPGGYRVTIRDFDNSVVGCFRAWIVQVAEGPEVNVEPIEPGCAQVLLSGTIDEGSITPYFNPPADPIIIDANTEITVCMSANHTFVSDLGFHLVGPLACGSPDILLAPNPGTNCNAGNNISNLCFTTEAAPNFQVCTMGTPLNGTFDSYGAGQTPINWAPLYGCDATQPGWKVQIYDCVSIDVGALTSVTLTFTGVTICGDTATVVYASGAINSVINDNSCSAFSASSYTVPVQAAVPISEELGFEWSAEPAFDIPGFDSELQITLDPGPFVSTDFTLAITLGPDATCGGINSDTEFYQYVPPIYPVVEEVEPQCVEGSPIFLIADIGGGQWSGPGIVDASTGEFDPGAAGTGTHVITYLVDNGCPAIDQITIEVISEINAEIEALPELCVQAEPLNLSGATPGGTWSGPGVTDQVNGVFDPGVAGVGTHIISYLIEGVCIGYDEIEIEVVAVPSVIISDPGDFCIDAEEYDLGVNIPGGTWSGDGIINDATGLFDPGQAGIGETTISYALGGICPTVTEFDLMVFDLPQVNAGADQEICEGESAQMNATGAVVYLWSPDTGLSSEFDNNPVATPSSSIIYIVSGTDANGCINADTVSVIVNDAPQVTITPDQLICEGEEIQLNATGLDNYNWTPSSGLSDNDVANPTAGPAGTTTYTVTGTDENGCSGTASITIEVQQIDVDINATPEEGLQPLEVVFSTNTQGDSYSWNFGNGSTSDDEDPVVVFGDPGTYITTLTVTVGECSESATISILVYNTSWMFIPNIVTPNGDGENDLFSLEGQFIETFQLDIFDRWGQVVATLDDLSDNWDPSDVAGGTYYFVLKAAGYDGAVYDRDGTVTVVR
ncbi:MAG: gliding motility-associated C-terminal domain-containing protein [Flavobacteriales bacterium]|nr:gliding motility-associated C-terminal domain-containing protein [Flavobacteriales bacterium]